MVWVQMGVDDPSDILRRELSNCRKNLAARAGFTGVHDDNTVLADLDGNIASSAVNEVDIALYVKRAKAGRIRWICFDATLLGNGMPGKTTGQQCENDEQAFQAHLVT
jgi:hypothetical protein